MGGSSTFSPPFLMESGHANRETNTQDELYRDQDTQEYQDWIDNGNNQDHEDDLEDEDYWPASQLSPNEGGEKESCDNITDNNHSDDNLDLPLVPKLASSIPSTKALITPATPKRQSMRKIDQQTAQGTERGWAVRGGRKAIGSRGRIC